MLLLVAAACHGHTYHFSITEMNRNTGSSSVELVVTIHADDLEQLLRKAKPQLEIDRDPDAEKLACAYTLTVVSLRTAKKAPVPMQCLGIKVYRHYVDVYLEGKAPVGQAPAAMRNQILVKELGDQQNQLKLKVDNHPAGKLLLFEAKEEWKLLAW